MDTKFAIKIGFAVFLLTIVNFLIDFILGSTSNFMYYGCQFISNILIFILLGYSIFHADLSGIRLSLSVFAIYYVIGSLNLLVEVLIFNLSDITSVTKQIPRSLLTALVIAPVLVYLSDKWHYKSTEIVFEARPVISWIWRIAVGDLLYLVFYIAAGLTLIHVYPELAKFYNEKTPPPPELIFGVQLIRGLVFIGTAILVCRTTDLPLSKKAVLIGLIFSIIGGIAPLIIPSAEMPPNIRLGHGFEVGISNFLYGLVLGYLLGQKPKNKK